MNTPKLAIFDMDGLIFDSERLFMGFLQKAAADLGYEITPEKYALTLGVGGDTLAAGACKYNFFHLFGLLSLFELS